MQYFGGKARIATDIVDIINIYKKDNQAFLSPFLGGGWVEQFIKGKKILCDKHTYLIEMYKALQNGWLPPTELAKEEYMHIKDNQDEQPHLTGFVGFGCSFAGKWFGGYAKDKSGRNYCLNAHNSILKKIENGLLDNTKLLNDDYRNLNPHDMIIYCDPPYKGTTQYDKNVVGEFNNNEFWDVMREWSKNNTVLISEYDAPEDFEIVWQKEVKLDIRDKNNEKQQRVEKLFKFKNA